MESVLAQIVRDGQFAEVLTYIQDNQPQLLYGASDTHRSLLLCALLKQSGRPGIIVTPDIAHAEQILHDLAAFVPPEQCMLFPPAELLAVKATARSKDNAAGRSAALKGLLDGSLRVVTAPVEAILATLPAPIEYKRNMLTLRMGEVREREQVYLLLVGMGYERVDQVESRGQFSARGMMVDIYPLNNDNAIRLEFFGDEIDSLREFDPSTQRSIRNINEAVVNPADDLAGEGGYSLFSYLQQGLIVFVEPVRIHDEIEKFVKDNAEFADQIFPWTALLETTAGQPVVYSSALLHTIPDAKVKHITGVSGKSVVSFYRRMDLVAEELKGWRERGFRILLAVSSEDRVQRISQMLEENKIITQRGDLASELQPGTITVVHAPLKRGFELPEQKFVCITEHDIFGQYKRRKITKASDEDKISHFRDLKVGDYVVHINHGIGKYLGVETLDVAGIHRDYFLIRYAGEDKLYVPTDQVGLLQKYIGAEGHVPKLSKMGGAEWHKVKSKAKASVRDIAAELLRLYAERQMVEGYAFSPDTPWQQEFEDTFPYQETPDQLRAIDELKSDMEKTRPMDRLLCGDVGFGKTEVAMRAAFKAVMDQKQVAVLVPTTVLAQQHYQTFSSRMEGFPVNIGVVSRFQTAREQQEVLKKLALGTIDILIGTHRLLQSDVIFKDLGLIVVDEEQRFGVAQKEKLKRWCSNADVLTLTATPIPRTLHMSLVGARDISIINTPPEDRFPVQTYVIEYRDDVVREAILREVQRGGQVFFVFNSVQRIDYAVNMVRNLVPGVRVTVGHGQMPEHQLERAMLGFVNHQFDVLVCTTIIENGLDVPNVNTIIVYDADHYGLSQLYQMRGRVGRSTRTAYAYLTYRRDKVLSEIAEKRLQAITEFTELGSGFKVAMRDLEIRGAGNILGAEQHGHLVSVGFEMYCKLLEETVQELKGEQPAEPLIDTVLEFDIDAYLSGDYIDEPMLKIEIYQKIAAVRNLQDVTDITDELLDRFGEMPEPVHNLLLVAEIKALARKLYIHSIVQSVAKVTITFTERTDIAPEKTLAMLERYQGRVILSPGEARLLNIKTKGLSSKEVVQFIRKMLEQLS